VLGRYERQGSRVIRWGRNVVTQTGVMLEVAGRTSIYFVTDFDESGVADEAQVVPGDSGGGVFADRGGTWELVGIHSAALTYTDPPQPGDTAVFGNASFVVDLHPYVPQIQAITSQPPGIPLLPPGGALLLAGGLGALARRSLSRPRRDGVVLRAPR